MSTERAFSIKQISALTGLGKTKIYELIKSSQIPARKIGKRTIVRAADLEAFLSSLPPLASADKPAVQQRR